MTTLFGWFFCLTALQHLLKPPRNAFFLSTAGSENLPWVYIASAFASAIAMLAYGRWVAPLERERQVLGSMAVISASLVVFWTVLRVPTAWTAGAFYVWINVFSLFLVSQFFLVGNDLFDPRQAKRVLGFIGAGGLLGGMAGAAAAGFLANEIGTDNLLWLGVGLLGASTALAWRAFRVGTFRTTGSDSSPAGDRGRKQRLASGLAVLRRVPHLKRIAAMLFFGVLVSTFVDWIYNTAVENAHPGDPGRQAEFIGQSFAIFNGVAFLVQIFLTGWLLRVVGLAGSLLFLPAGLALGAGSVLLLPNIWTAAFAKGSDASLRYSIDQAAREILYLPVPTVVKDRAKPFIDIVVQRGADGIAGVLILLGTGVAAISVRGVAWVTLGLIVGWGFAVLRVRRSYRRAIEKLLAVRDVDLEQAAETSLDSAAMRELLEELDPDRDAQRVLFALDLMVDVPAGMFQDEAAALLEHPDPEVRVRAIELVTPAGRADVERALESLLDDTHPRVRARARLALCRIDPEAHLGILESMLASDDPHAIEAALVGLIQEGDEADVERAGEALSRLVRRVGSEGAPIRAACARALGRLERQDPLQRHLETLLSDSHPDVLEAAIESAGAVPRRDLPEPLLPHLASRDLRPLARRALAEYGEEGIPYLAAALRDPELPDDVRRWIPGVFVAIGSRTAYRALLEGLPSLAVGRHRLYALKALNKMRRRHPGWAVDDDLARSELDRELESAYAIERQLATLQRSRNESRVSGSPADSFEGALEYEATRTIERAFRLQGLLYPPQTIYFAYAGLTGRDTHYAAHALELLENVLARSDAERLVPLMDPDVLPRRRAELGGRWYSVGDGDLATDLERVFESSEPWLQAYAVELANEAFAERLGPELARVAASGDRLVRSLARRSVDDETGDDMALSSVEKAVALRRAELLSALGADDLLQLAAVAEERAFEPDEVLFYEGEEGDYLYVVLEGNVRIEREAQEIFTAGKGQAIGTFAIFDNRPRSATARAVGGARTLALHRADMAQILADNYSLVEGIFKYLTTIIRTMNEEVYAGGEPEEGSGTASDGA